VNEVAFEFASTLLRRQQPVIDGNILLYLWSHIIEIPCLDPRSYLEGTHKLGIMAAAGRIADALDAERGEGADQSPLEVSVVPPVCREDDLHTRLPHDLLKERELARFEHASLIAANHPIHI